jgi:Sec-independent protein translocase protein TatA
MPAAMGGMGRTELLLVVLLALAVVGVAWYLRTGAWKRGRIGIVAAGVLVGLLLLTRRVGWGELAVVLVLAGIPFFLLAPRRR